jgi:anaphase-promoting complex subunit 8
MVLAKDQNYDLAKLWLLKSVLINPWNWGAWQELCCLVRDARDVSI